MSRCWVPRFVHLATALLSATVALHISKAATAGSNPTGIAAAIPDGGGGMLVVSYSQRAGGSYADLYVQKVDAAGVPQWETLGAVLCTTADPSRSPVLASDGAGGVILAWIDFRSPSASVYAQRVNSAGVPLWTVGGVQVCASVHYSATLDIIEYAGGGAIVAWRDARSDNGDIYAQRVDADGAPQWQAGGRAVCSWSADQQFPALVPDLAGGAIVSWSDTRNGNGDIYAQRVNASGAPQWAAGGVPVCTAAGSQRYRRAMPDGVGGAFIVWADQRSDTGDIYAQRVNASGAPQWTAQGVAVCATANEQTWPDLASDGAGGIVVTWQDNRNGTDYDIYAQRLNGSGVAQWTALGVAVCASAGDQTAQVLASDGAAGAIVTWSSSISDSSPIVYAQRVNSSGVPQWTQNGLRVCPDRYYGQADPAIVEDQAGGVFIAWREYGVSNEAQVYGQRLTGAGVLAWGTAGVNLIPDPGVQRQPAAIPDGSGGTFVTWMEGQPGETYDIYARRITADGTVTLTSVAVCTATGDQIWPAIAPDGTGGAVIAWADLRSGLDVGIYAQRLSAGGVPQWTDDGVALYAGAGIRYGLGIVSDGAGGAIVCWQDARTGDWDIYAQRVNAAGVPQWIATGVPVCTVAGVQTLWDDRATAGVVSDGSGGAYVAWTDSRAVESDIYAQRISSAGTPLWTTNGEAVCAASGAQRSHVVAFDTFSPGLFVAWEDYRSGRSDVYVQRMTPTGSTLWITNGVAAENASDDGDEPRIVADGLGGAIVAWRDRRTSDEGIYAQRLSWVGGPLWTVNGVTVCGAAGDQRQPEIIADANNGVIVVWEDRRGGVGNEWMDLYAQRLNSQGITLWSTDGVAVCDATNSQANPFLVRDDVGGAVISWEDRRGGMSDYVYSQRVNAAGAALWTTNGVTTSAPADVAELPRLHLEPVHPNPARGPLTLAFALSGNEPATIEVLDVAGHRISSRSLAGLGAGRHVVTWERDRTLASGVYLVLLRQGGQVQARKVCVLN